MADGFATTYAKAVDDLAGKIFFPGLIASLLVEFGPMYRASQDAGLIESYFAFLVISALVAGLFFLAMMIVSVYMFEGHDISPWVGIVIMPLGFAGLFPEQFQEFPVPYSQVTGVAILAWSFVLLKSGGDGVKV